MKKWIFVVVCCFFMQKAAQGQELFIQTEPASNMATHSLGIRLNNEAFLAGNGFKTQYSPELMYGASSIWMLHASAFLTNEYTQDYRFGGVNVYAKYRFLSRDALQKHFRMAVFGRISETFGQGLGKEVTIEGAYTGANIGLVATQLLHKLALSATVTGTSLLANKQAPLSQGEALGYSLSAGYLLLPKTYNNYKQTNMNLYLEFLGKNQEAVSDGNRVASFYLDASPGVQFIIQSRARIDLAWRMQLAGNMDRGYKNLLFLRLEYNIFNV